MKQLLPVGFYDLLFDEAEKSHKNVNNALASFFENGYRLIKTPLVEFEDKNAANKVKNSFHATDAISGNSLIFRNDITPQIARLLKSRLSTAKLPLKLCYVGDILHARNNELYANRQQTQVGIEIIGRDDEESNFEIVKNILTALKKLLTKNLLIEFSLPDLLEIFLTEIDPENKEKLRQAIKEKNISLIRKLGQKNAELLIEITLSNNNLEELIQKVTAQNKSEKILSQLQKAQRISDFFNKENFTDVKLRFDLFGDRKSSYHNDIAFDIFCADFPYPIAKGGKYKINQTNAVGAAIYMDYLLLA